MSLQVFHRTETEKKTKGSTVRFKWDFKKELQKLILLLESSVPSVLAEFYIVDDMVVGNNNLKIWIRNDEYAIEKIINCVFRYHHDDEWFGNIHIELVATELSQKPKSRFLGKFNLAEKQKIQEIFIKEFLLFVMPKIK
jgi:hypothetical protein